MQNRNPIAPFTRVASASNVTSPRPDHGPFGFSRLTRPPGAGPAGARSYRSQPLRTGSYAVAHAPPTAPLCEPAVTVAGAASPRLLSDLPPPTHSELISKSLVNKGFGLGRAGWIEVVRRGGLTEGGALRYQRW